MLHKLRLSASSDSCSGVRQAADLRLREWFQAIRLDHEGADGSVRAVANVQKAAFAAQGHVRRIQGAAVRGPGWRRLQIELR